ncbi:MAG: aquaporin [Lachnospiraceae bacterium]|nr:aquaporin [Lachnospiraceae bacterium]
MGSIKKYLAEFIGTMVLVIVGCGTAMAVGCEYLTGSGYLLTALAFGLAIVAMAYSIGNISGCHINPAVSAAFWMKGDLTTSTFLGYVCSQCLGALAGAGILKGVFALGKVTDETGGLGTNGLAGVNGSVAAGLIVECILTFIFIIAILGVTSKEGNHGSFAGLVIGLTLVLVHILGIRFTGTSVNPARSLGPALVVLFTGKSGPISDVWVFIVGPLAGSVLATIAYRFMSSAEPEKVADEAKEAAEEIAEEASEEE